MALLSLIVPVYRVEDYLATCLDSILHQQFTDFEVIAVDDASDDESSAILSRYAERDKRIKVVSLDRNVGLGAARNIGIGQASGDYVWCVDSDDWLAPNILDAVADRLARTDPDVLITGYARVYPDERVVPEPITDIAATRPMPASFTFAEQPGLLNTLWIACNKVIRRQFLLDSGLTFRSGWYEDVSFVLPLLLTAARISVLDRFTYAYRQRPAGAITQTVSERHFEVFAQWHRVFEFMDGQPGRWQSLRTAMLRRMVWHCMHVLGHASRVPKSMRRRYFLRLTELYRRHLPADGCPTPAGVDGLKHRLVAAGAYDTFEALMALRQAGGRLTRRRPRSTPRPVVGALQV